MFIWPAFQIRDYSQKRFHILDFTRKSTKMLHHFFIDVKCYLGCINKRKPVLNMHQVWCILLSIPALGSFMFCLIWNVVVWNNTKWWFIAFKKGPINGLCRLIDHRFVAMYCKLGAECFSRCQKTSLWTLLSVWTTKSQWFSLAFLFCHSPINLKACTSPSW